MTEPEESASGSKHKRMEVAPVHARTGVWKKNGATLWPELAKVAIKLMGMHPSSASTERNWSLWGRVYTAARNALSLDRARKIITFCFNYRAQKASMADTDSILDTIEQIST